jgi:hypothetical protein
MVDSVAVKPMGAACAASRRKLGFPDHTQQQHDDNTSDTNIQSTSATSTSTSGATVIQSGKGDDTNDDGNDGSDDGEFTDEPVWLVYQGLTSAPTNLSPTVTSLVLDFNQLQQLDGTILAKLSRLTGTLTYNEPHVNECRSNPCPCPCFA